MADLLRWFKVWVSIMDDPHFQELPLEQVGRWVLLGAMTASVGSRGKLTIPGGGRRLCQLLRVDTLEAAKKVISDLPNVLVEEGKNRHGRLTVTWKNWTKFQRDSTQAQRAKASRSKRRGEEIRGDERTTKATTRPPVGGPPPPDSSTGGHTPQQPDGQPDGVWTSTVGDPRPDGGDGAAAARAAANGHPPDAARRMAAAAPGATAPPTPAWPSAEALVWLWNADAPRECPRVTTLSPARRKKAVARLREFPDRDFWERAIGEMKRSRFLRGLEPSASHPNWRASFDWLLATGKSGAENVVVLAEGNYSKRRVED